MYIQSSSVVKFYHSGPKCLLLLEEIEHFCYDNAYACAEDNKILITAWKKATGAAGAVRDKELVQQLNSCRLEVLWFESLE